MTTRKDVIAAAGKRPRLIYTCNCGWIDMMHAATTSTRADVGPQNLWNQVKGETGTKSKASGPPGFQVIYTQDMGRTVLTVPLTTGVTGKYYVRSGLSLQDQESVALAIFMEVSLAFEGYQDMFPRLLTDSGFSQEDLVSNWIAFYSVVRPRDYLALCERVSEKTGLAIWDKYGAVGDTNNKNRTFRPVLTASAGCEECAASKKSFPAELQSIKPAAKGTLFRDWSLADDLGDAAAEERRRWLERDAAVRPKI
jgi:hypothetical protein